MCIFIFLLKCFSSPLIQIYIITESQLTLALLYLESLSKYQLPQFIIITKSTYLIGQNFVGKNISSEKIFDTNPKFRHFCPIFAWILYWNIGQNFRRPKFFVGQNFRHQVEISTILSDESLSDKVYESIWWNIHTCLWQCQLETTIS